MSLSELKWASSIPTRLKILFGLVRPEAVSLSGRHQFQRLSAVWYLNKET
jgi:hypothetical protein